MCQATIVMKDKGGTTQLLEDVIYLKVEGDEISFAQFFEDPTVMKARIEEIDFLKHKVHIIPIPEQERQPND
jgi:predicted RNA-binding protein